MHSLRSVMHSLGQDEIADVHVLTGDLPLDTTQTNITDLPQDPTTTTTTTHNLTAPLQDTALNLNNTTTMGPSMRIGQVPAWLGLHKTCETPFRVHHHWDVFKMRDRGAGEAQAAAWRKNTLPSFNSIGIETQLVALAPELSDDVIYVRANPPTIAYRLSLRLTVLTNHFFLLTFYFYFSFFVRAQFNDDFFLTRKLRRSDFTSPLFGSVFRMQNHVRVSSTAKGTSRADPDGEWPSLTYANWLLDQRFGQRVRPYLAHFVKTYSAPILQEVAAIWGEELTEVSV